MFYIKFFEKKFVARSVYTNLAYRDLHRRRKNFFLANKPPSHTDTLACSKLLKLLPVLRTLLRSIPISAQRSEEVIDVGLLASNKLCRSHKGGIWLFARARHSQCQLQQPNTERHVSGLYSTHILHANRMPLHAH